MLPKCAFRPLHVYSVIQNAPASVLHSQTGSCLQIIAAMHGALKGRAGVQNGVRHAILIALLLAHILNAVALQCIMAASLQLEGCHQS